MTSPTPELSGWPLPPDHHHHVESHKSHRAGWLRAAVLGANDGVVSTAALIAGVGGALAMAVTMLIGELTGATLG